MKKTKLLLGFSALLFAGFILLLVLLLTVDVRPAGPEGTEIGLAACNLWARDLIGTNLLWYTVTDWLGLVALAVAAGFAVLGLCQWVRRRRFLRVDADVLLLGALYALTFGIYVFFEFCIVNYRPILLGIVPEASFPSSHTLLVVCILETATLQWKKRISRKALRVSAVLASHLVATVTVVGRLLSGVHWLTDILAALLLGGALVLLYAALTATLAARQMRKNQAASSDPN